MKAPPSHELGSMKALRWLCQGEKPDGWRVPPKSKACRLYMAPVSGLKGQHPSHISCRMTNVSTAWHIKHPEASAITMHAQGSICCSGG